MKQKLTLKQIRMINDASIDTIANYIGVTKTTWSNYENRRTAIPAHRLIKFCSKFNVDVNDVDLQQPS